MEQTREPLVQTNRQGMELALAQARLALEEGEVPVGAIVVDEMGRILAQAHNVTGALGDPMAHGELLALQKALAGRGKARLAGCTLYVTLEPCAMCAGAAQQARLAALCFGAFDGRAGCCGSVYKLPADERLGGYVPVLGGLRAAECQALLDQFFSERRKKDRQSRTQA